MKMRYHYIVEEMDLGNVFQEHHRGNQPDANRMVHKLRLEGRLRPVRVRKVQKLSLAELKERGQ